MIEKLRYVTVLDNMLQICGLLLVIVIVSIAYVCIHKKQSSYDPKVNNMKDNEYRNIRIVLLLFDLGSTLLLLLSTGPAQPITINGIAKKVSFLKIFFIDCYDFPFLVC